MEPRHFLLKIDKFGDTIKLFFNKFIKASDFTNGEQLEVIEYSAYQALKIENETLQTTCSGLEVTRQALEAEVKHWKGATEALSTDLIKVCREKAEVDHAYNRSSINELCLQESFDHFKAENERLTAELNIVREALNKIPSPKEFIDTKNASLVTENEKLTDANNALAQMVTDASKRDHNFREKIDHLKSENTALAAENKALISAHEELKAEFKMLKTYYDDLYAQTNAEEYFEWQRLKYDDIIKDNK